VAEVVWRRIISNNEFRTSNVEIYLTSSLGSQHKIFVILRNEESVHVPVEEDASLRSAWQETQKFVILRNEESVHVPVEEDASLRSA
jgi:hypothetical protein